MSEKVETEIEIRKQIHKMLVEAGLETQAVNDIFGLINTICDMKTGE